MYSCKIFFWVIKTLDPDPQVEKFCIRTLIINADPKPWLI
jgi:hypothetical protein